MQGEDGRRRKSSFAESTNSGSANTLFVPPEVLEGPKSPKHEVVEEAEMASLECTESLFELSVSQILFLRTPIELKVLVYDSMFSPPDKLDM